MLTVGEKAPNFAAPDQHAEQHQLSDYKGRWVLLYFYPKDDTPGCTKEAQAFRDAFQKFIHKNLVVLGVSADSVSSHKRFAAKYHLPFSLLSDQDRRIIQEYGAAGSAGQVKRVSLLINHRGIIAKIYPTVKPEKHAAQILHDYLQLNKK